MVIYINFSQQIIFIPPFILNHSEFNVYFWQFRMLLYPFLSKLYAIIV